MADERPSSWGHFGSKEFIKAIPKTDLHLHLDGSLRLGTLIELAKEGGVELPFYTEEELRKHVFKDFYTDLTDYLRGFRYTTAVLRTAANCERVAYELGVDNYEEGVRYFEVRFAPQLLAGDGNVGEDIVGVLRAVDAGLRRASREANRREEITYAKNGLPEHPPPPFRYGIIGCGMKYFDENFSPYYRALCAVHRHDSAERRFAMASHELVKAMLVARAEHKVNVVAIDLAGAEAGFPPDQHREAYAVASKELLSRTVHAGEAYGPESIFQAISVLHAQRIGHGFHIFDVDRVNAPHNKEHAAQYVDKLVRYVSENRITLEVCLTSNLQTMPELKGDIKGHVFPRILAHHISACLNTDNRLVSNTTVCKEVKLAVDEFKLTPKQLRDIVITGFKRSFYPGPYADKLRYIKQAIRHYDSVQREFGVSWDGDGSVAGGVSTTTA